MRTWLVLPLASDRHLADQVQHGSEGAFEVLFERHGPQVREFCSQMLGSREEADDAVQQTFLAAFRDLARGRRPRAMRPWLLGIARRRCLAILADRRSRAVVEAPAPAVAGPAGVVAAREDLRFLLADLATLPDDQRAALVLSELGGVSHREIAEILGCRREKVKALVFQARESLDTSRAARETPCAEIRLQLTTLEGGALRRRVLRRHLRDCGDCREFRARINGRRRGLGLLLPFGPSIGLKRLGLGALFGGGGGGAALGGGGVAVTALVAIAIPVGVVGAAVLPGDGARDARAEVEARGAPATSAATAAPVSTTTKRSTAGAAEPRPAASAPAPTTAPAGAGPRKTAAAPATRVPGDVPAPTSAAGEAAAATDALAGRGPQEPSDPASDQGEAPGQASRAPGQAGRPADPPGQANRPAGPSGQANRPADPPGQANRPADPPGQANKPADPPGQANRPADPPGQANKPADPPGQANKPADPPGQSTAQPPGNAKAPADPPGRTNWPADLAPMAANP